MSRWVKYSNTLWKTKSDNGNLDYGKVTPNSFFTIHYLMDLRPSASGTKGWKTLACTSNIYFVTKKISGKLNTLPIPQKEFLQKLLFIVPITL